MKKSTKIVWLIGSSVVAVNGWFLPHLGRAIYQKGASSQGLGVLIASMGVLLFLGGAICAITFLFSIFVKEKVVAETEVGATVFAGLWKRLCASLVDGFILGVSCGVIVVIFMFIKAAEGEILLSQGGEIPDQLKLPFLAVSVFSYCAIHLAYFTFTAGKFGASFGKKVLKLKILKIDGTSLGYREAFFRYLLMLVYHTPLGLGLLLSFISAGLITSDKNKRSLHDRICKTVVIYEGNV